MLDACLLGLAPLSHVSAVSAWCFTQAAASGPLAMVPGMSDDIMDSAMAEEDRLPVAPVAAKDIWASLGKIEK